MKKYHIYLPIEILVREINSKILFSYYAINKNYRVYLGTKSGIDKITKKKIKNNDKSGIYFYKSQIISNKKYIHDIKKAFEKFVVLDEELGVGVANVQASLDRRVIDSKLIDKFFVIGKKMMKNILNHDYNFKKISIISGWPKYDFYHDKNLNLFSSEVDEIKNKYGNFYLFSSNYGALSNKGLMNRVKSNPSLKNNINKSDDYNTFLQSIKDFNFFKKSLCLFLKRNPNINFVIRPHPSDQLYSDWKIFEKFRNAKVINKYDIVPWIMASKGLVHRGCSTAIDAYFLKKPAYYLLPDRKIKKKEVNLTYKCSIKINNLELIKNYSFKKIKNQNFEIQKEIFFKKKAIIIILKELEKFKITKENNIFFNYFENFINYTRPFLGNIKITLKKNILGDDNINNNKIGEFIDFNTLVKKIESINSENIKIKVKKITRDVFEIEKI